jgi:diamine N-acetyltransferase
MPEMATRVELREITRDSVRAVLDLAVEPEQEPYVATNARSIAEAHFEPRAWFRAVYADDEPVGFVMAFRDAPKEFCVWRFMIAGHQGKGYGRRALELLVDEARKDGVEEIRLSYHPGEHSPHAFYARFGFVDTGDVEEGEVVMRLTLDERAARPCASQSLRSLSRSTPRRPRRPPSSRAAPSA